VLGTLLSSRCDQADPGDVMACAGLSYACCQEALFCELTLDCVDLRTCYFPHIWRFSSQHERGSLLFPDGNTLATLAAGCARSTRHGKATPPGHPVAFAGELRHESDERAATARHPACEGQRHIDGVVDACGETLTLEPCSIALELTRTEMLTLTLLLTETALVRTMTVTVSTRLPFQRKLRKLKTTLAVDGTPNPAGGVNPDLEPLLSRHTADQ